MVCFATSRSKMSNRNSVAKKPSAFDLRYLRNPSRLLSRTFFIDIKSAGTNLLEVRRRNLQELSRFRVCHKRDWTRSSPKSSRYPPTCPLLIFLGPPLLTWTATRKNQRSTSRRRSKSPPIMDGSTSLQEVESNRALQKLPLQMRQNSSRTIVPEHKNRVSEFLYRYLWISYSR